MPGSRGTSLLLCTSGGGGESGRLPNAFGEGDDELDELDKLDELGTVPGTELVPLEYLQQEAVASATPGDGVSAACESPAEIEKDASAGW